MPSGEASKIIKPCARTPLSFLQEALAIVTFEPGNYEVFQTFAPLGENA